MSLGMQVSLIRTAWHRPAQCDQGVDVEEVSIKEYMGIGYLDPQLDVEDNACQDCSTGLVYAVRVSL